MNIIKSLYLNYFSVPPENRTLYQAIGRLKPSKIVEFGIQRGIRTLNMLELAKQFRKTNEIEYYCVDPFEGRTIEDGPGLSLRKAYKSFAPCGIQIKPVPGNAEEGLQALSEVIDHVDLLIVATPSLDWIERRKAFLMDMLKPTGMAYIGKSTPDESPFELQAYSFSQLEAFEIPKRRAA